MLFGDQWITDPARHCICLDCVVLGEMAARGALSLLFTDSPSVLVRRERTDVAIVGGVVRLIVLLLPGGGLDDGCLGSGEVAGVLLGD